MAGDGDGDGDDSGYDTGTVGLDMIDVIGYDLAGLGGSAEGGYGSSGSPGFAGASGDPNNPSAMGAAGYASQTALNDYGFNAAMASPTALPAIVVRANDPATAPQAFLEHIGVDSPNQLDIQAKNYYDMLDAQSQARDALEARSPGLLAQLEPVSLPPIVIRQNPPAFRGAPNPSGFRGPVADTVRGIGQFARDVNTALGAPSRADFNSRFGAAATTGRFGTGGQVDVPTAPEPQQDPMGPLGVTGRANTAFLTLPGLPPPPPRFVTSVPMRGFPPGPQLPGRPGYPDFPPARAPIQVSVTPGGFDRGAPSAPAPAAPGRGQVSDQAPGSLAMGPWDGDWKPPGAAYW
jgi:hypothetical protein